MNKKNNGKKILNIWLEDDKKNEQFQKLVENLHLIAQKDETFLDSLTELIQHLANTYGDKYDEGYVVRTRDLMKNKRHGEGYNCGNALKYMQRYITEGFSKSGNMEDLKKSIHFIMFELERKLIEKKNNEKQNNNPRK